MSKKPGKNLLQALTQDEMAQLLDILFSHSGKQTEAILSKLSPDTAKTISAILNPKEESHEESSGPLPASLAKMQEDWKLLWGEWKKIVREAEGEDGNYFAYENQWDPPYCDTDTFLNDLLNVVKKLQPLLDVALEQHFKPLNSLGEALIEAREALESGFPEWYDIEEEFCLDSVFTHAILEWEWKMIQREVKSFVHRVFKLDQEMSEGSVGFDHDGFVDFFDDWSAEAQKELFDYLQAQQNVAQWKAEYDNTRSHWHTLYMVALEKHDPSAFLIKCEALIPTDWEQGLPVIEACLAQQNYPRGLEVLQKTFQSLLAQRREHKPWVIDETLLINELLRSYIADAKKASIKELLEFYQQVAKGMQDAVLLKLLEIQIHAFDNLYNWDKMIALLNNHSPTEKIKQALKSNWKQEIVGNTFLEMREEKNKTCWLHWLIDASFDAGKKTWFQEQINEWLKTIEKNTSKKDMFCSLLTGDLLEISKKKNQFKNFYQVVLIPDRTKEPNFRRHYLQALLPEGVLEKLMPYWQKGVSEWLPSPKQVSDGRYETHAQWMAALKEVNPQAYQNHLALWQKEYKNRRNLWKEMQQKNLH